MKVQIVVQVRFDALHCWPDAPPEVDFLRNPHRHEFHVAVHFAVTHEDRDREFFIEQDRVRDSVAAALNDLDTRTWSCEQWAAYLLADLDALRVSVFEDGENGAIVDA